MFNRSKKILSALFLCASVHVMYGNDAISERNWNEISTAVFAKKGALFRYNFELGHPSISQDGMKTLAREFDKEWFEQDSEVWLESNPPQLEVTIHGERFSISTINNDPCADIVLDVKKQIRQEKGLQ